MNEAFTLFSHLSAPAAGALGSAIWQGALLAALVGLCLRLFPGLSAAARSVIWLNVFILLAFLHLLPFLAGNYAGPHLASHAVRLDLRWSLAVAAIWLALSVLRAAQLVVSAIHLYALAGRALPVATPLDLDPLLLAPANRRVRLCTSDEVARPSVLGFFRPRILVPPVLLENLSPSELRQVVIHEMEHLRRADDWTNLLQKLALVLFPLNPVLLWVERRLCAERELACDDRVLNSGSGRKAYALCLTHLAEFSLVRRGFSLVLGAWERRPELVRRVQRILSQPARTMGRRPALAVCSALLSGVVACTLILARAPQLVGFVPVRDTTQLAQLPAGFDSFTDSATLIHTLGGSQARAFNTIARTDVRPQPVALKSHPSKTLMPCPVKFVRKHRNLPRLQPDRLASLRIPSPPSADLTEHAVMLMTRWTELESSARAAYAVSHQQHARRSSVVSAVYLVRTPTGWLIIQI